MYMEHNYPLVFMILFICYFIFKMFTWVYLVTAGGTVGFLAYLLCYSCDAPSGSNPLVFDRTKYNYGSYYSTRTGKFTAPVSGLYLITSQLYGRQNTAEYFLRVNGVDVTYANEVDEQDSDDRVMGQTTVVLKLNAGQQVWIDPNFSGSDTIGGTSTNHMSSYFGAHLLKAV